MKQHWPGRRPRTSPDPHLVTQPPDRLPSGVYQDDLAATDCDTPARRPSNVDVDEPVAGADCNADYQAVCRSIDLESSDQLSHQRLHGVFTLSRHTGDHKVNVPECTLIFRFVSRTS